MRHHLPEKMKLFAGALVVGAAGVADGVAVAASGQRPYVELLPKVRADGAGNFMQSDASGGKIGI